MRQSNRAVGFDECEGGDVPGDMRALTSGRLEPADMQRTCCGNDHCGCQRCARVLQVGSKPAPPFRHAGRDATIWWHGKLTQILDDMPVERCCSTSSGAASTTATHTAWLSAFTGSSGVQEVSAWHDHARPPRPTSLHFAVERLFERGK